MGVVVKPREKSEDTREMFCSQCGERTEHVKKEGGKGAFWQCKECLSLH
ncbi:MAG: hypothetical protein KGY66_05150 [Candidatus Thermoplasmatota archaeon]|nr:hypothetical protein [Candidatus Thermoplasmatota archaeon]MBS3790285.1 hypothetical protein [Candidatus Thermoplasmatota archaeon]